MAAKRVSSVVSLHVDRKQQKNIGDYDVMHGYCMQLSSISTDTNTLTPEMPQSARFLASYAHDHITNSVHIPFTFTLFTFECSHSEPDKADGSTSHHS